MQAMKTRVDLIVNKHKNKTKNGVFMIERIILPVDDEPSEGLDLGDGGVVDTRAPGFDFLALQVCSCIGGF